MAATPWRYVRHTSPPKISTRTARALLGREASAWTLRPYLQVRLDAAPFVLAGQRELRQINAQLKQGVRRNRQFVRLIADLVGAMVAENFARMEGPSYAKWRGLAASTQKDRRKLGLSPTSNLLIRSGDLYQHATQGLKVNVRRGNRLVVTPNFNASGIVKKGRSGGRGAAWRTGPFAVKFAQHSLGDPEQHLPARPFFYWRADWNVDRFVGQAFVNASLSQYWQRREAFKVLRVRLMDELVGPATRDVRQRLGSLIGRYRTRMQRRARRQEGRRGGR